jgi:hypothetical protein
VTKTGGEAHAAAEPLVAGAEGNTAEATYQSGLERSDI